MNIKAKYNKVIKVLAIRQSELWNITRLILPLENSFKTEELTEDEVCIVPTEPNFQLPNVFLRTKKNPSYQKFIDANRSNVEWNQTVDEIVETLDEIDLGSPGGDVKTNKCSIDQGILEVVLRRRYGHT